MLRSLDHVTLRCQDLGKSVAFYEGLLGLRRGARPPFGVPGHWLYAGDTPIVHLVEGRVANAAGSIDHVAFEAVDRVSFANRLFEAGVQFELRAVPDGSALQMFLVDPDGARIEFVFRSAEDR
jgi:catechol 2,3-dioxygenase-like lactoylglutathione lyase family enzyme